MAKHKIQIELTDKQITEFCRDHYYCDPDEDGIREKWQPFEYDDDETIEEHIECDVYALMAFLGIEGYYIPQNLRAKQLGKPEGE